MRNRLITFAFLILCLISKPGLYAQVLKDSANFRLMRQGVDWIYNMEFKKAKEVYDVINNAYPGHPMNYIFRGLITYWENYPLLTNSPQRKSFESDMRYALELCERNGHPGDEAEYLLANIGARGMLLLFYADNALSMDVIGLASTTYQYVKQSFDYTDTYADFYFITGLYNYYREAYPEAHPVYKPLAFLFPKGDKIRGLRELQIAAKSAIMLKAEAYSFLTGITISFENDFHQAFFYSKALHDLYPQNPFYYAVYIKNLLLIKRYDEAEMHIRFNRAKTNNNFFKAQLLIFQGIVYEKKYRDPKQAQAHYSKGIKEISPFGVYGNEFKAYGYYGLSRISEATKDNQKRKFYRKQADDFAVFENVNFDN